MKPAMKSALAGLDVLALLAAACARTPKTTKTAGGDAELVAACKADVAISEAFTEFFSSLPEPEGEGPPSAEFMAEFRSAFDEILAGPLADFEDNAPKEIADETKVAVAGLQKFRETGDESVFEDEEVNEAADVIDKYFFDNCDDPTAEIAAVEYEFQGAPASAEPGILRISFSNDGEEHHELVIFTKKPGTTESFDELLALPEEEAEQKADFVNATDGEPGESSYLTVNLKAGEYLFACFVSQGTVGETEGEGPPHFTLGMKRELQVA